MTMYMIIQVYHISHKKNRKSISEKGIIANEKISGRIKYGPSVFFSINENDLGFDFVNYENVDCWSFNVNSSKIKKDPFSGSKNHFYVEDDISPKKIKLNNSY